jgi:D-3-phosphoglycerate dehydrogenase
VEVFGRSFNIPIAEHFAFFRYRDQPGMIGRVGTIFGERGVNIVSAAVAAEEGRADAVMAVTTDAPVPEDLVAQIVALADFYSGRAVDL